MTHACLLLVVVLVGALGGSPSAADDGSAGADFVGRWNIEIDETGDTFRTAWLKVAAEDGGLGGALVWKWGSVVPIRNVRVEDGELRFTRGRETFSARLAGGELRGVATMRDGKQLSFVGRRATEMCDVAGTWRVGLEDRPDDPPGTLVLEERDGKITGKAVDPQGNAYAVRDVKLDGRVLSLSALPNEFEGSPREVRCEVRGDALVGQVTVLPPGETEKRTLRIAGRRQRAWGDPVVLLEKDSLEGWGPRNPKRKFGWKVEDGVLENSPPDIDVMSAAKFRDFRLQLEYKVDPGSNSGIYLRGRYELQILGDTRVQDHGNMAVYSRLKPRKNPIKLGDWNALDVTFIGRWLTVVLNGETVYDNEYLEGTTGGAWDPAEEEPGPLLLQGDHGKVWFRNIVVTPVAQDDDRAGASAGGKWIQLFNGKDLAGWKPKITGHELGDNFGDTFRVEDGVLKVAYDRYREFGGKFGHLFYDGEFSDYILRVEYRFTGDQVAGGPGWAFRNSGLMIHGQPPESMRIDQEFPVSIEVQLLGGRGTGERSTANLCTPGTHVVMDGKLHTRHCTDSSSKTYHGDQWVTASVEVRGNSIKHIVEGETVLAYTDPQLDERDRDARALLEAGQEKMLRGGTISLQSESHPIEFRKVELLELEGDRHSADAERRGR